MKRAFKGKNPRRVSMLKVGLIGLVTYLGLFAMLYGGITPEQYDIQVGVPSPTLIKATKDIQDTVTTEALREEAANAVEPSYKSADPTVVDAVMSDLNVRFDSLRTLREELSAEEARALTDEELEKVNDTLSMSLSREQIATLIETSDATLESAFTAAADAVREVLEATLPEGQEANAVKAIRGDLSQRFSAQLTSIIAEAVRGCIRPNMLIDEEITEANREKARESVQPVMYIKDQTIVSEGEVVTLAQYTMIASMGILSENSFDLHMMGGVALLVLLVMLATGTYLYYARRDFLLCPKWLLLLSLILLLQVGGSLLFREANSYLMPVSLGLLLVALLMDAQVAIFVNVMLTLLTSLFASTASSMFSIALMSILCSPVIALLFSHRMLRTTTLLAGVIVAAINFLITLAFGLFNSAEMHTVVINALWAAGGGVVSAILCIAFQPLLEWLFNLATSSKLIELSNPNQPLLRRLLLEASGTYHHSIIVANLAEAGCTAIGANGLLARVGAYYHDIGKLKRPLYFKENQMGDNPHDRTDPRVSTAILTAHTRDGAQMAQKARIPAPVVDIIRQHHGDTPVTYFYDKALKLYGDQVDIAAFRYEGPRPQSREAAVVMLADSIEAATRALPNPDPEKIEALIRKLVRGKLTDGQLDNSNLTFSDLDKICGAFSTVLTGVFHERIEYPEVVIPPRTERIEPAGQAANEPKPEPKPQEAAPANPQPAQGQKAVQPTPSEAKPATESGQSNTPAEQKAEPKPQPAAPANPQPAQGQRAVQPTTNEAKPAAESGQSNTPAEQKAEPKPQPAVPANSQSAQGQKAVQPTTNEAKPAAESGQSNTPAEQKAEPKPQPAAPANPQPAQVPEFREKPVQPAANGQKSEVPAAQAAAGSQRAPGEPKSAVQPTQGVSAVPSVQRAAPATKPEENARVGASPVQSSAAQAPEAALQPAPSMAQPAPSAARVPVSAGTPVPPVRPEAMQRGGDGDAH